MPYKDIDKQREAQRKYRDKNRDKYNAVCAGHKRDIQAWLMELKKGLACKTCGENHPACLDFHHKDPSTKLFTIGNSGARGISKQKILEEIDKCDVLCANCHRKHHHDEK